MVSLFATDPALTSEPEHNKRPTLHGTARSGFSEWEAETIGPPFELVEMCLAHKINNATAAAYRRTGMIEPRRPLMQAWADYLDGPVLPEIEPGPPVELAPEFVKPSQLLELP